MPVAETRPSLEEIARLGAEAYKRHVLPSLQPEDDGKFVALDIWSGDYQLNDDDYAAVEGLLARNPTAEVWLGRVGQPTAYKIRL